MTRFLSRALVVCSVVFAAAALPLDASGQQFRLRMGHDHPLGSMYDEGQPTG